MFYKGIDVETAPQLHALAREDAILVKCQNKDISATLYRTKEKYGFVRRIPNIYLVSNDLLKEEFGIDCPNDCYIIIKVSSLQHYNMRDGLKEMRLNADYTRKS